MRVRSLIVWIALELAISLDASLGSAAERMLGVTPSDGGACLVKEFPLPAGATILGAQFESNDPSTVFPEVALIRGPLGNLAEGTQVASATAVTGAVGGVVTVSWSVPVAVSEASPYYVVIRLPAGPGKTGPGVGPGIGASDVQAPSGSFLASGAEEPLGAIRADLEISLLMSANVAAGGGPYKAGAGDDAPPAPENVSAHTFLASVRPNPAKVPTPIRFGLAQPASVSLAVYNIAGRRVRLLARGLMPAGPHEESWDGRNDAGTPVASGVYITELRAGEKTLREKLVLSK